MRKLGLTPLSIARCACLATSQHERCLLPSVAEPRCPDSRCFCERSSRPQTALVCALCVVSASVAQKKQRLLWLGGWGLAAALSESPAALIATDRALRLLGGRNTTLPPPRKGNRIDGRRVGVQNGRRVPRLHRRQPSPRSRVRPMRVLGRLWDESLASRARSAKFVDGSTKFGPCSATFDSIELLVSTP